MVEHVDITDPEIHEPKGVATASSGHVYAADGAGSGTWGEVVLPGQDAASAKQFFVSDGAGGGSWMYEPTGYGYYQDAGAGQVFNTSPSKFLCDGAGLLTKTSALPPEIRGTGQLWDTVNSKVTPIREDDAYDLRIDLPISANTGSPSEITFQLDIGAGASPSIVILDRFLSAAKTPPYTVTFGFPLVALSPLTVTNGVQFFMYTDSGSVTVLNPSVLLVRNHGGEI